MNKLSFTGILVLACVGCTHTSPPAVQPTTDNSSIPAWGNPPVAASASAPTLTPLPAPIVVEEAPRVRTVETPCGKEVSVHVGEGDIKLPKLNITVGSKVDTEGFILHVKDATFRTREYCQSQASEDNQGNVEPTIK
jgi:hypothetical protein